jgi:uncharacterized protein (DUF58 family)
MHWWQNLRTLWPGALRQQVTRTGLAYSGAIVIVTLAAVLSANNLLFLILAAMLSILAISGFVSKLTLAGLEIDLLLPPHISARRTVRATVRLKNLKRWMPSFSIRVTGAPPSRIASPTHDRPGNISPSGYDGALFFPVIPGGVTLEEPIELRFPTRGRHSERTFQLTTGFPFGFAERRETVTLRHDVIVYPCLDPRPSFQSLADSIAGEIEAWRRGPGHDFYRIRPYEALESARHVDWKATAHTRSLQVREFARDEDQMVVIFLDLDATPDQRAWFETAVECAAFVAFRLSESGHRVRLLTQNFDLASPAEGDIHAILTYLALVSSRAGARTPGPDPSSPLQIVLSANPERVSALGWGLGQGSRILGPDSLGEEHPPSPFQAPRAL